MHKLANRGLLVHTTHDEHGQIAIFDRDGIRSLYFESGACQSSLRLTDPISLVLGYTQCVLAGLLFHPNPKRILLIGLGGGALAVNLWNTPTAPCDQQLAAIKMGFSGQVLRLPVEKRANLIALALTENQTRQTLKQLRSTAQQMTARLEIDFGKYLDSLQRSNSTELRRGTTVQMESDQSDRASLKS